MYNNYMYTYIYIVIHIYVCVQPAFTASDRPTDLAENAETWQRNHQFLQASLMDSKIFSAATVEGTAVSSLNCAVTSLPNFKRLVFLGPREKKK